MSVNRNAIGQNGPAMPDNTTHTPGPWSIERCACNHPNCKMWLAGPRLHAEATLSEADAYLIAATPDMYNALKALLDPERGRSTTEYLREAWDMAAEAIAKAEGKKK